jgi:putative polyhydroxyalkanoate system protein
MADIHIHREHTLGLAQARKIARRFAEAAEAKFDMQCTVIDGEDGDTLEFTRSGMQGQLRVTADRFDLTAQLGMLLGTFSKTIEAEIEKKLDGLLAAGGEAAAAVAKNAATGEKE